MIIAFTTDVTITRRDGTLGLIAKLEIGRLEDLDLSDPNVSDSVNHYIVRRDGTNVGHVTHRYGDGIWPLLRAAINQAVSGSHPEEEKPR